MRTLKVTPLVICEAHGACRNHGCQHKDRHKASHANLRFNCREPHYCADNPLPGPVKCVYRIKE